MSLAWILLVGCLVPKKELDAIQAELNAANAAYSESLGQRDARIASLEQMAETLAGENRKIADLTARHAEVSGQLADLRIQHDEILAEKAALLKDKSQLKASIADMEQALEDLAARRAAAEARVAQYKDLLARFKSLIDSGKLRVKIVDGRMVVELATDILFDSGKAELSAAGKAAVGEVAKVLATIPDRSFQVEGHTDNVPIRSERFPSNWELASARSIVVVRALVEGGVTANRVSGASYSEFRPVADNSADPGRAANRRIEIVVVPDLSELPGFEELQKIAGE